jgi:hypothetical protein
VDGQRMDQLTRALARGVTRRSAVKGIAVALGLSAAGVAHAPAAAARQWCACKYLCGVPGSGTYSHFCTHRKHGCRAKLPSGRGQDPCVLDTSSCGFSSQDTCVAVLPL